jgi:hypothetical protein
LRLVAAMIRNKLVSVTDNTEAKGFVEMHVAYKKVAKREVEVWWSRDAMKALECCESSKGRNGSR